MSEQHVQGADAVADLNNELKTRREKLASLREQGIPFPNDFRRDHTSDQLHADFDAKENEELEALNIEVSVAGRMMTRRIMGKASFVTLQDVGGRIQLYVARDDLPEGVYNEQFKKWDLGDILGAKGKLFKTKTGELSIHCTELRLLTKALRRCRTNSTVCRIRKRAIVNVTWISSLTMNPAIPLKCVHRLWLAFVSSWLLAALWK
ncbi:lysyl-tRNA synthetase [Citrobacter freundii]|nr:lysyl-tRNA synthetase [Citrobacter freundii]